MMNWIGRLGLLCLGSLSLAFCSNFPPPTTSDSHDQYYQPRATKTASQTFETKADTIAKINDLQAQVDKLNGKLEVLSYELEQDRNQNKKGFSDLDSRLSVLEMGDPPTTDPNSNPAFLSSQTKPDVIMGVEDWINNINDQKDVDASIQSLEGWVEKNPKDSQRIDALLGLAKGYYFKEDYPRSVQRFQTVVDQSPQSGQACEARFHQGLAFVKLEDPKNAKLFFQETIELCPKHPTKQKAQDKLKELDI